jgi:hypothetical protein
MGWSRRIVLVLRVGALTMIFANGFDGVSAQAFTNRDSPLQNVRVGHALSARAIARIGHVVGRRMQSGAITDATTSTNWSGLVQEGSGIEGAEAYWTVPSIQPSGLPLYSSTWVGVDGANNSSLIQTGTDQDTSGGYDAWWEIIPAASVVITGGDGNPAPVLPGDQMLGSVFEASAGTWTIYLQDLTEGWTFQQDVSYDGPGTSAEWIEEAPTISDSQSSLANFGSVGFIQTAIDGDFGTSGTTWYGTDMDASNEEDMVDSTGTILLAAPSAPTPDASVGQDFVDTYEDTQIPPPTPPTVRVSSPSNAYQLSTIIRVTYSATDPSSPIASYDVRYYVYPWNSSSRGGYRYPSNWQGTFVRSVSLTGTPGDEYCFQVRATSEAGVPSAWTNDQCANLPLGVASLHASAGSSWRRHYAPQCYLCSYAETTSYGATLQLSGAWANHVMVVATRCPSCGVIDVWIDHRFVGAMNTHGPRTERDAEFVSRSFPNGRVTVYLVDASRRGAVIVQGLGIA